VILGGAVLSGRFRPLAAPFPFRRPPAPAPLTLRSHALLATWSFSTSSWRCCRKVAEHYRECIRETSNLEAKLSNVVVVMCTAFSATEQRIIRRSSKVKDDIISVIRVIA